MKVSELIDVLKKHDPEMLVTVDGYEEGNTANIQIDVLKVILKEDSSWYEGEYEIALEEEKSISVFNIGRY